MQSSHRTLRVHLRSGGDRVLVVKTVMAIPRFSHSFTTFIRDLDPCVSRRFKQLGMIMSAVFLSRKTLNHNERSGPDSCKCSFTKKESSPDIFTTNETAPDSFPGALGQLH